MGEATQQKRRQMMVGLVLCIVLAVIFIIWPGFTRSPVSCSDNIFNSYAGNKGQLLVGQQTFTVAYAISNQEKATGLGGVRCLSSTDAMLFVYDEPEISTFWMKDMYIPIDIIWLDANGSVITVAPNVSPRTYPKTFAPEAPATFVLETKAGVSQAQGWGKGTHVIRTSTLPLPSPAQGR